MMLFNFDTDIEENEVVIDDEVVDASTDIQDVLEMCDTFSITYSNLTLVQEHVKKFGFNKELIHLMKMDNLCEMLDLDMPDNIEDQDEIIVKLNMEADFTFYESVKRAKDEFMKILTTIINKMKEIYRAYMINVNKLNKQLLHYRKEVYGSNGQYIDEDATLKKEVKACSIGHWRTAISELTGASKHLAENLRLDFEIGFNLLNGSIFNDALNILNYNLTLNTNTQFFSISRVDNPNTLETKTLLELGWTVKETYNLLGVSLNYIEKMRVLNKFLTHLEEGKKMALKDERLKISKGVLINQVKTMVHLANILLDGFKQYLTMLIKIADKAVMKKG